MVCSMIKKAVLGAALSAGLLYFAFGTSAPSYVEVYGSDRGHDPATCRLTVCADC